MLAAAAGFQELLNLSEELVVTGMAALKAAQFRSAASYLSTAKQIYVAEYRRLPPGVALLCTQVNRSVKRGLGPNKHTEPLPLDRFEELPHVIDPLSSLGVQYPRRLFVVALWFLLREIEVAAIKVAQVNIAYGDQGKSATLLLPVSKADVTPCVC